MGAGLLLSLASILCYVTLSSCRIREIPLPDSLQKCYNRVKPIEVDRYVASVFSWLCENTLMNATYDTESIPQATFDYVYQLHDIALPPETAPNRSKRQSGNRCVRKEYRMLTLDERRRYHGAVNALKRDTSIRPNKYDAIARYHTPSVTNYYGVHGGPGFLGWHRIFLLMYETALRQVDPRVCLPYWDSTLDHELQDPFMSSIWTPEYLGTPRGNVIDGPFANWVLPNGVQLIRNVGIDGSVLTTDMVNDILSRTSNDEIVTSDTVEPKFNLEYQHGAVHFFIGGAMSTLQTAAFDPVFFMHHAFIDYTWERFRSKLKSINVNPSIYPSTNNPLHQATALTGFPRYTQTDGYSETIANRVIYQPVPSCSSTSPSCGSGSLVCDASKEICVPTRRSQFGPRTKREATTTQDSCNKPSTFGLPNQNDFCVGTCCDTDEWVAIPVKIISVRPPKFKKYGSYLVRNGRVDSTCDIFSPNEKLNELIYSRQGNLKTYERCQEDAAIGQVFLYSHGINNPGYYKESTIVDQKFTVSVSLGFIGVQKPSQVEGGVTKVLLRAHDSCGRVCRVACKDAETKEYKVCSGAVAIDEKKPRMYRRKFEEAVLSVIDFSKHKELPKFKEDNIFITFYCDYQNEFPFADRNN